MEMPSFGLGSGLFLGSGLLYHPHSSSTSTIKTPDPKAMHLNPIPDPPIDKTEIPVGGAPGKSSSSNPALKPRTRRGTEPGGPLIRYSNSERVRMVELMVEIGKSREVQRLFQTEFNKKPPSQTTIVTLYKKFKETGSVGPKTPSVQRNRPKSNEEAISRVKEYFKKHPEVSTSQGAKELQISRSTVRRIIQELRGKEGGKIRRGRTTKIVKRAAEKKLANREVPKDSIFAPKKPRKKKKAKGEESEPEQGKGEKAEGNGSADHEPTKSSRPEGEESDHDQEKESVFAKRNMLGSLFFSLDFAAQKLRNLRNKDLEYTPLINFSIGVANILVHEGGVDDTEILQAAILQRTESFSTTYFDELYSCFSPRVANIVSELDLDKRYSLEERRINELRNAPKKSPPAQLIGMADMIYELRDYARNLPLGWTEQSRYEYFIWAKQVVQHYYPANPGMASSLQGLFARMNV